eukprot:2464686-Amphidinium_carterae.1
MEEFVCQNGKDMKWSSESFKNSTYAWMMQLPWLHHHLKSFNYHPNHAARVCEFSFPQLQSPTSPCPAIVATSPESSQADI